MLKKILNITIVILFSALFSSCVKKEESYKTSKPKIISKKREKKRNYKNIVIDGIPNSNLFQVKKETLLLLTHKGEENFYKIYDLFSKKLIFSQKAGKFYLNALLLDDKTFGYSISKHQINFVDIKRKKIIKRVHSKNMIGFNRNFEAKNFFIIVEIADSYTRFLLYDKKTLKKFKSILLKEKYQTFYNRFKDITYPSFTPNERFFKFFVGETHYVLDLKEEKLIELPYFNYRNFLNHQTEGFINQNSIFYSIHRKRAPLDFAIYDINSSKTKIYNTDFKTYIFGGYFDKNSFWTINAISQRFDRISIFNLKTGQDREIIKLEQYKNISNEIDTYSPYVYPVFTKDKKNLLFFWKRIYHNIYTPQPKGNLSKEEFERFVTIYNLKRKKYIFKEKLEPKIKILCTIANRNSFILLESKTDDLEKPIKYFVKVIWIKDKL